MLIDKKNNKVLKERLLTPEDALSFIKNDCVKKRLIKKGYKIKIGGFKLWETVLLLLLRLDGIVLCII